MREARNLLLTNSSTIFVLAQLTDRDLRAISRLELFPSNLKQQTSVKTEQASEPEKEPLHYGSKRGEIETTKFPLSHELRSERSEQASKRVSAAEGASEASSPEQASE